VLPAPTSTFESPPPLAWLFVTVVVPPLDPQADAAATATSASAIEPALLTFMRNLSVVVITMHRLCIRLSCDGVTRRYTPGEQVVIGHLEGFRTCTLLA
jgi:hypothetical protein